jgi:CheY-like chemotaxis protein
MSGLELARALKANAALAHIPVILSSAALGASARAHPALFAAFLDKPYPARKLLQTLSTLLGKPDGVDHGEQ